MDPLFIVHPFFARKQIKQVCKLQVQTMQDLYKQEAMPILKLWLNQFYDKSSTKPKSWRLPHQSFHLYQYNHMRTLESSLCLYFPPEPHWGCLTGAAAAIRLAQCHGTG